MDVNIFLQGSVPFRFFLHVNDLWASSLAGCGAPALAGQPTSMSLSPHTPAAGMGAGGLSTQQDGINGAIPS